MLTNQLYVASHAHLINRSQVRTKNAKVNRRSVLVLSCPSKVQYQVVLKQQLCLVNYIFFVIYKANMLGCDNPDLEVNFAAECLLTMSKNYSQTRNENGQTLFKIQRILMDLSALKQEPVPNVGVSKQDEEAARWQPLGVSGPTGTWRVSAPDGQSTATRRQPRQRPVVDAIKKTHRCQYQGCDKVYGKSSHLKAHLRTHTGLFVSSLISQKPSFCNCLFS